MLFIALYSLLNFIYFKPFLKLIEARKSKTSGLEKEASSFNHLAAEKESEYSQKLEEVKKRARDTRERYAQEAKSKASKMLHEARVEQKARIVEARSKAVAETETTFKKLQQDINGLVDLFVKKLTEKKVGL